MSESGSSSSGSGRTPWPTPVVQDAHGHVGEYPKSETRNPGLNLATAADGWPTPTAQVSPRGAGFTTSDRHHKPHDIASAVGAWPTPDAGLEKVRATPAASANRQAAGKQLSLEDATMLWPTPRAEDAESAGNHPGAKDALNAEARLWRTPDAPGEGGPRNRQESTGEGHQLTIAEQAEHWPTPTGRDYKGGYSDEAMTRKDGKSREGDLLPQVVERWPTPNAADAQREGTHARGNPTLPESSRQWPTPRPTDENMDRRSPEALERERQREGSGQSLALTGNQWPTPSSTTFDGDEATFEARRQRMAEKQGNNGAGIPLAIASRSFPQDPETLPPGAPSSSVTPRSPRRLNPRFVSWLMGWPLIAAACSDSSETAWCRCKPPTLSSSPSAPCSLSSTPSWSSRMREALLELVGR